MTFPFEIWQVSRFNKLPGQSPSNLDTLQILRESTSECVKMDLNRFLDSVKKIKNPEATDQTEG